MLFAATGPSHAFWMCYVCCPGFYELARSLQISSVTDSTDWSPSSQMVLGNMDCWSRSVDAADVKKHLSTPHSQTSTFDW